MVSSDKSSVPCHHMSLTVEDESGSEEEFVGREVMKRATAALVEARTRKKAADDDEDEGATKKRKRR